MKIEEIIKTIDEAFNTKIDNLQWHVVNGSEIAPFTYKDIEYRIQIRKTRSEIVQFPELKGKNIAEISFYKMEGDAAIHNTTREWEGKDALRIIGIVANALDEKFNEYDAFFFTAKQRHGGIEAKENIYSTIANQLGRLHQAETYNIDTAAGKLFILTKVYPSEDTLKQLSKY